MPFIVLCLILDSRQNKLIFLLLRLKLYCALFWIQGKTSSLSTLRSFLLYCALFWIQGKTVDDQGAYACSLYCALFWIQGKTTGTAQTTVLLLYCALLISVTSRKTPANGRMYPVQRDFSFPGFPRGNWKN